MEHLLLDLASCTAGQTVSFVAKLVIYGDVDHIHVMQTVPGGFRFHFTGALPRDKQEFTLVEVLITKTNPVMTIGTSLDTAVLSFDPPTWRSMHEVIEACSGMGALGFGALASGFHPVVAVDMSESMLNMWKDLHDGPTVCSDVCNPQTAVQVWKHCPRQTCFSSGFSCQPYSELGDKKSQFDDRARSLPGSLKLAHFLHSQVIVLECVKGASTDEWVRSIIHTFAADVGFHVREITLDLQDNWVSRRSRWWVVLTSPMVGPIDVLGSDFTREMTRVCQVIPSLCHWDPVQEAQLSLSIEEQNAFLIADDDTSPYLLNFNGTCPCALHSWGSQLSPCPCGCRKFPLSQQRLAEKGLFGVITRSAAAQDGSYHFRHLHPSELAALVGVDPTLHFNDDMKLALCALGQLASPFQSMWVFAHVHARLEKLHFGLAKRSPFDMMLAFRSWLVMKCRIVWPEQDNISFPQTLEKAVKFWSPAKDLSLHQLMNMPYWQQLRTESLTLAYVLDVATRGLLEEIIDDFKILAFLTHLPLTPCQDCPQVFSPESALQPFQVTVEFHRSDLPGLTIHARPGDVCTELLAAECRLQGARFEDSHVCDDQGTILSHDFPLSPDDVIRLVIADTGIVPSVQHINGLLMLEDGSIQEGTHLEMLDDVPCMPLHIENVTCEAEIEHGDETPVVDSAFSATNFLTVDPTDRVESSYELCDGGDALSDSFACTPNEIASLPPSLKGVSDVHTQIDSSQAVSVSATIPFTAIEPADPSENHDTAERKRKIVPGFVPVMKSPLIHLESEALCRLLGPMPTSQNACLALCCQQIFTDDRRHVLSNQRFAWADDEIRWHLDQIKSQYHDLWSDEAKPPRGFLVPIDPLLTFGWSLKKLHGLEAWLDEHFQEDKCLIGVFYVDGHWIPFLLWKTGKLLRANSWDVATARHEPLLEFCNHIAAYCGLELAFIQTHRLFIDGYCGAFAIAFLRHVLLQDTLPELGYQIAPIHDDLRDQFQQSLVQTHACAKPWLWGTSPVEQAVQGLLPILEQQGVPHDMIDSRARSAVRSIGAQPILAALKAKSPWRQLKVVGNQVRFQFILPSELEAKIAAEAGSKPKNRVKPGRKSSKPFEPPGPIDLDPTKIVLLPGTFEAQGHVLNQVQMHQVGPLADGVVLTKAIEAEPYLRSGKPVSKGALGLLILHGPDEKWNTNLDQKQVTVPCQCVVNQQPLLIDATLVQLGMVPITKKQATTPVQIDSPDVATLKLLVYRDEVVDEWSSIAAAPIRYVQQQMPLLKLCKEPGCTCQSWHNHEKIPTKSSITDLWRRQFMRDGFKPEPAATATIFSACIRIPECLLDALLRQSGVAGIYLEPRTQDAKTVDPQFVVVWLPKMEPQELAHVKQTNPSAIGFARVGTRRGLRTLATDAASLHSSLKPDTTYLPSGPRLNWLIGPVPFGSDRAAISKVLKSLPWDAKVLQPTQTLTGRGVLWSLQSISEPPSMLLQMQHGEVLITKQKTPESDVRGAVPKPVATTETLALCGKTKVAEPSAPKPPQDPWLNYNDPWGSWKGPVCPTPDVSASVKQLESKVQEAVLAKLPKKDDAEVFTRMQTLESQVQGLMTRQQTLETKVQESAVQHTQDIQQLQLHIQGQVEHQQQSMASMFEAQMAQIRGLLSKRPREEEDMNL